MLFNFFPYKMAIGAFSDIFKKNPQYSTRIYRKIVMAKIHTRTSCKRTSSIVHSFVYKHGNQYITWNKFTPSNEKINLPSDYWFHSPFDKHNTTCSVEKRFNVIYYTYPAVSFDWTDSLARRNDFRKEKKLFRSQWR